MDFGREGLGVRFNQPFEKIFQQLEEEQNSLFFKDLLYICLRIQKDYSQGIHIS